MKYEASLTSWWMISHFPALAAHLVPTAEAKAPLMGNRPVSIASDQRYIREYEALCVSLSTLSANKQVWPMVYAPLWLVGSFLMRLQLCHTREHASLKKKP